IKEQRNPLWRKGVAALLYFLSDKVGKNLKQMVFKWKKSLALQQKSCKKGSRKASFFIKKGL
ncbi:hypothetical protein, partial [Streptococcus pseudopneumoniae]